MKANTEVSFVYEGQLILNKVDKKDLKPCKLYLISFGDNRWDYRVAYYNEQLGGIFSFNNLNYLADQVINVYELPQ